MSICERIKIWSPIKLAIPDCAVIAGIRSVNAKSNVGALTDTYLYAVIVGIPNVHDIVIATAVTDAFCIAVTEGI